MSSKLNDFSSPPSDSRCDLRRLLSAKPSCFLLLPFAPSPRLLIIHAMGQPLHSQPIRLSFFKELNIFRRWLVELSDRERVFGDQILPRPKHPAGTATRLKTQRSRGWRGRATPTASPKGPRATLAWKAPGARLKYQVWIAYVLPWFDRTDRAFRSKE